MPVGMSAVAVLLSMALVLSMSLPSEAAGSSTAGLSQWGAGLQTRIRAGERRLLSNHTNYTETPAPSPAPAKNFEVRFTVSLPYSKADFTADKQTKFKEAAASAAGAAIADVTLTITVSRRCNARCVSICACLVAAHVRLRLGGRACASPRG